jgi:two-component system, sensor histidine kinase and response regulator
LTGRHIPIIALTAHAMKRDKDRCLAAGMDAYVSKPLRPKELIQTLCGLLTPVRQIETLHVDLADETSLVFDPEAALERMEGDRDLLREMSELFGKQTATLLSEIADAVQRQDGPTLNRAAHRLKGSIGIFGALGALKTAGELESRGSLSDFSGVHILCARLTKEVEDLQIALAEFIGEVVSCAS